jgi:hypothetical protein
MGSLYAVEIEPEVSGKVRELRFRLLRQQTRVTYWLAPGRRVVLLTIFRKDAAWNLAR